MYIGLRSLSWAERVNRYLAKRLSFSVSLSQSQALPPKPNKVGTLLLQIFFHQQATSLFLFVDFG